MEDEDSSHSSPSPPNPSFRLILEETATSASPVTTEALSTGNSSSRFSLLKSISTKELKLSPSFADFPSPGGNPAPPRLSFHTSTSGQYYSPPHPLASAAKCPGELDVGANYRCIFSVHKKDGQVLSMSISNNLAYTGTESNVIRVWKFPEFVECDQLRTKVQRVVAMAVSGFNDQVCAAYSDGKVRIWRRTWAGGSVKHSKVATIPSTGSFVRSYLTGKDKMQMKHMGPITSLAVNPTGDVLYSASLDTAVKVWRLSDFRCIETIQAHPQPVNAIVTSPDGVLYTASDDATIRVWRSHLSSSLTSSSSSHPVSHSLTLTLLAKNSPIKALALAAGGEVLYGGCTDGYVHFWLRASGSYSSCQLQYGGALHGHSHAVLCLASVGRYIASGSADSTIRVWAKERAGGRHECVAVMVGHRGPVRCIVAYRESVIVREDDGEGGIGCILCTGSLDGVLKVWRVSEKDVFNFPQKNAQKLD